MVRAVIAIFTVTFCISGFTQNTPLTWSTFNLQEGVKVATFTRYLADSVNGTLIKTKRMADQDGSMTYENFAGVLEFNRDGQLISWSHRDTMDVVEYVITYEYNHNGTLVAERHIGNNIEISSTVYSLGKADQLIADTTFLYRGIISGSALYFYDKKGCMVLKERFYGDGDPSSTVIQRFDKNGRMVEYKQTQPDGDHLKRDLFVYDESGKLLRQISPGLEDTIGSYISFEFDKGVNNIIRQCWHEADGTCRSCQHFSYDKYGNLTLEAHYSCDGIPIEILRYIYRYDVHGNRIEKRIYTGSNCGVIAEATYTYY